MWLIIVNILVGFIWMGLSTNLTVNGFTIGFIIGFIILSYFSRLFQSNYGRQTLGFIIFILKFLKALVLSNIEIAKYTLLMPIDAVEPNIIEVDTQDLTELEIYILAQCITLTPGTTTIKISDDFSSLFIHAFNGKKPKEVRESIFNDLTRPILEFTR